MSTDKRKPRPKLFHVASTFLPAIASANGHGRNASIRTFTSILQRLLENRSCYRHSRCAIKLYFRTHLHQRTVLSRRPVYLWCCSNIFPTRTDLCTNEYIYLRIRFDELGKRWQIASTLENCFAYIKHIF